MKKAVMYLNQFFGQIGGEDKADFEPVVQEGLIGPAMQLDKVLDADVTHTVICGDNYMGSNTDEAVDTILSELEKLSFDIFIAGPAFQAGRYGMACGQICKAVHKKFGVPVIDPAIAAMMNACMQYNCKTHCGWTYSRRCTFERPPAEEIRKYLKIEI